MNRALCNTKAAGSRPRKDRTTVAASAKSGSAKSSCVARIARQVGSTKMPWKRT
jgi:hypothetical protein